MNPLNQTLTRFGFLVWTLIWFGFFILLLLNLNAISGFDLWVRLLIGLIFTALILLIAARRLQNAGFPAALAALALLPIVGYAVWLFLLFVPTKKARRK